MKKILFFTFLFLFSLNTNFSFAQEMKDSSTSAEVTKEINYTLPYPGLLPDNPLYFLKSIRDGIVNFLISDPVKKADFNLLQADKHLSEGVMLFDKGKEKYRLAVAAVLKGENYFNEAIKQIDRARKQKKETGNFEERLYQAALKHEEVLKNLQIKARGDIKESLNIQMKRAVNHQKRVKQLTSQIQEKKQ
ncbi:MAG: DUF5667 domain-containing protein [Candidatus Pacearchaeota archaeon]